MTDEAKKALDLRLARGEISHDDYAKTLDLLTQGSKTTTPLAAPPGSKVEPAGPPASPDASSALSAPPRGKSRGRLGYFVGILLATLAAFGATMLSIRNIQERTTANKRAWDVKHAAGLMAICEQKQERLLSDVRQGHFEGVPKKFESMLTAYAAALMSQGVDPDTIPELVKAKGTEVADKIQASKRNP